jgi:hypothetical protein
MSCGVLEKNKRSIDCLPENVYTQTESSAKQFSRMRNAGFGMGNERNNLGFFIAASAFDIPHLLNSIPHAPSESRRVSERFVSPHHGGCCTSIRMRRIASEVAR